MELEKFMVIEALDAGSVVEFRTGLNHSINNNKQDTKTSSWEQSNPNSSHIKSGDWKRGACLESGEQCFFDVPYPGGVFFSKNQVKAISKDRVSNSEINKCVPLTFIASQLYQQRLRVMVIFLTQWDFCSEISAAVFEVASLRHLEMVV